MSPGSSRTILGPTGHPPQLYPRILKATPDGAGRGIQVPGYSERGQAQHGAPRARRKGRKAPAEVTVAPGTPLLASCSWVHSFIHSFACLVSQPVIMEKRPREPALGRELRVLSREDRAL